MKKVTKFMKKAISVLTAVELLSSSVPVALAAQSEAEIVNLKVNYVTSPIGIDTENISFSWQMESDFIGKMQSDYEIEVSDENGLVWNSGTVASSASVGIPYSGDTLAEGHEYLWSVKVTDEDGNKYQSATEKFETGVTNDPDWQKAEFISLPASSAASIFRREHSLSGKVKKARLYATAIGIYEAKINGESVYKEENGEKVYYHMNPGYDNGNYSMTYQAYDVTKLLSGKDAAVITFTAAHGWRNGAGNGILGNTSGQPGVKAMLVVEYTEGKTEKIITNTSDWKGSHMGPVTASGIYYGEDYDARREKSLAGYTSPGYDDSDWIGADENNNTDSHIIKAEFQKTSAKYVRLTVSEIGPAIAEDGETRLQIMEMEALTENGTNAALGSTVTASHNFESSTQWRKINLTDGDFGLTTDSGYTTDILARNSLPSYTPATPLTIQLNFSKEAEISELRLHSRVSKISVIDKVCPNYPKRFTIEVSLDGKNWTTVTENFDSGNVKNSTLTSEGITAQVYPGKIVASRNMEGRFVPQFDQSAVSAVIYNGQASSSKYPGGEIAVTRYFAHNQPQDAMYNKNVTIVPEGKTIFEDGITLNANETMIVNMGQNLSAVPEITFKSSEGATVMMKMAEMLNDGSKSGNGATEASGPKGSIYTKSLRTARSEAHYTFSGSEKVTYRPSMSYFGYQYIEIKTTAPVTIYNITSRAISSVSEQTGFIETNNTNVNRLFLNALYGQLSNFFTIPTDCNQRDERLSWTGDEQAFAKTANYNFASAAFLSGYQDVLSEITLDKGYPGAVTSLSGYFDHWAMGWSDAMVINTWTLYNQTGDKTIISRNYDALNKYMDYMKSIERGTYQAPRIQTRAYGDWLAFQGTGYEVIADYYYGYVNLLMSEMSSIYGDEEKASYYQDYFEKIKEKFLDTHVEFDEGVPSGYTALSIPTTTSSGSSNIMTNTFPEKDARYVKITVSDTANGTKNDGEYRLQIMEAEISSNGTNNLAAGKSVTASDTFTYSNIWHKDFLTDGNTDTGYTSNNRGTTDFSNNPAVITIDLGQTYSVDTVKLNCRIFNEPMISGVCVNYPKKYTIETSEDGTNWETAGKYFAYDKDGDRLTIKSSIGSSLFMNKGGVFEDNSQTALLWMLKLGFYDSTDMRNEALRLLVKNIRNENPDSASVRAQYGKNTLSVGFLGSNVITPVLTQSGRSDVSYDLLLNDEMPSWLFEVKAGATTIWERWNSYTPNVGFGDSEMNSFNHFAYGSVAEWMYEYMAGISSKPGSGFKEIILQPTFDRGEQYNDEERIKDVSGMYNSYYGTIKSEWSTDNGELVTYSTQIPSNTTATLYLPVESDKLSAFLNIPGVTYVKQEMHNGFETAVFNLKSGSYLFTVEDGTLTASATDCIPGDETAEENNRENIFLNLHPEIIDIVSAEKIGGNVEITYSSNTDIIAITAEYDGEVLKNTGIYNLPKEETFVVIPGAENKTIYLWQKDNLSPVTKERMVE